MSRYVKVQKTQTKKARRVDKGSFEGSPFWNFLSNTAQFSQEGDLQEPRQANPDVLSEENGMYHISAEQKEAQKLVQRAIKGADLSEREHQIVEMLTYSNRTQADIADILGISQPAVSIYFNRALEKIRKFIEKENK